MKLYATVTSERASKGQGGNEYIEIELNGTQPYTEKLFYMRAVPDNYGHATIKNIEGSISFLRAMIDYCNYSIDIQLEKATKGKKQTGEKQCVNYEFCLGKATLGDYCKNCADNIPQ